MTDESLILEARKITTLTNRQAVFLIDWYIDQKDEEFGFREVKGFQEQLTAAIDFYRRIEIEWQNRLLNNRTRLTFEKFFIESAKKEMVDLPKKLVKKLRETTI